MAIERKAIRPLTVQEIAAIVFLLDNAPPLRVVGAAIGGIGKERTRLILASLRRKLRFAMLNMGGAESPNQGTGDKDSEH